MDYLQGGFWEKLIKNVIVIALIVNIYLYMERHIHVSELLNLPLLIQRNSENICHTNLYIFINKETAPVGTAVWAGAFDRQPAG